MRDLLRDALDATLSLAELGLRLGADTIAARDTKAFDEYEAGDFLDSRPGTDRVGSYPFQDFYSGYESQTSAEPPDAEESPAGSPSPLTPPGTLATSELLTRSAVALTGIGVGMKALGVLDDDTEVLLANWTAELRDRAAQLAAHGD